MNNKQLILFDGVCSFCNGAVNFIIKRDHQKRFVFAPIQSKLGQSMMKQYGLLDMPDTFALISTGSCLTMSDAVIAVSKQLGAFWPLIVVLSLVPKVIRDYGYSLFGRHRYRFFGKLETCLIPTQEVKSRFVGDMDSSEW